MLNPFFLQGSKGEQGLVQDLINEQIKMYGVDIQYLPRKFILQNEVIREVIVSEFNKSFPIEAYVSSYDGYGGQGTLLSKFGIQDVDELTIVISKEKFEFYMTPAIAQLPDRGLSTRPREGDLIYFPLGDRIFEIKYVEHESPFYQLQKNYVYELKCELFRPQNEIIDTDIKEIDDNLIGKTNIITYKMSGIGVTAIATAGITSGGVQYIEVTNRGRNYSSVPLVGISKPKISAGTTAVGIASLIGGIVDYCDPIGNLSRVQSVDIIYSGSGYTEPPNVEFYGGGGDGAEAIAYITDGCIDEIIIQNPGFGYINPPNISITGVSSIPASAYAIIESGIIKTISMVNCGSGYTEPPSISIDPPNLTGIGTYSFNETVVGTISSATGIVNSWNINTRLLNLTNIDGDFIPGEILVGQESNANYTLIEYNEFNEINPYSSNKEIEDASDLIVDFSEDNPFGNP